MNCTVITSWKEDCTCRFEALKWTPSQFSTVLVHMQINSISLHFDCNLSPPPFCWHNYLCSLSISRLVGFFLPCGPKGKPLAHTHWVCAVSMLISDLALFVLVFLQIRYHEDFEKKKGGGEIPHHQPSNPGQGIPLTHKHTWLRMSD